ncbi:hydantoinase B/oxoprolinase family protein [Sphingomonas oligophenolica]|uniref:5-oxoprolinase n=1 Tax=Sphingomonas oligophenolica TaxID=301154 RepID=A0A502CR40_9SPHN|nr:hydantoinase B/oxoprolinase family protein [Sphingomonas oligophenolica]TPG14589.1 5-oxoprolinase [Sphingomonas oligophenolica]
MTNPEPTGWHFWIDRGGTFTDVVAQRPDGAVVTAKLLSEDPAYEDAAIAAIRRLTGIAKGPLPPADIRIGTTIATNALLERKGEPVLLAITRGFGDAPTIGTQDRPDIFARAIDRAASLQAETLEIDERVMADGTIDRPLHRDVARVGLQAAYDRGLRAVAIVLMHGYRYTAHEAALADIAADIGFVEIAVSHRVSALARLIGRADTAMVDAYLSPVLLRYVERLAAMLGGDHAPLFMQSNGGLAAASAFRGKDAILSGPAGGIVGMAATSAAAGFDRVIGFDMGGTSTDVSVFAGAFERDNENVVAGVRIRAPMLRIHTVAAGGGSVCRFADGRFAVGPESAGADPGPASYRRGGPLTVTDCNLILGKLQPGAFPAVFGAAGDQPLDRTAAMARMAELLADMGTPMAAEQAAEGMIAIAVANMANAIRTVSVARGHDVTRFALACFGGAGGQHACLVADALGIEMVLVHPLSGVLSAYGMGLADRRVVREATLGIGLDDQTATQESADGLADEAAVALAAQGVDRDRIATLAEAHIRTRASDATIAVPLGDPAAMRAAFADGHRARFGYDTDAALVIDMLRVEAISATPHGALPSPRQRVDAGSPERVAIHMAGRLRTAPLHQRATLAVDAQVTGPALIIDPVATIVVEPDWRARVGVDGTLVLERERTQHRDAIATTVDPVRLEIFSGLFMAIASDMGAALQRSAASVNIRERLDFSCALFDARGNLIANAPHIPVHLGSMGDSIRAILARHAGTIARGDVYALNAPYDGGTHLPDITVVKPVFVGAADAPAYFVAARGHHADIGGTSPGSMPADSRRIDEEGIIFDGLAIVADGRLREAAIRDLLASGPYPARNPDQNLADLAAQVAACTRGADGLLALVADYGADVVTSYMAHVQDHSEAAVRRLIARLSDGDFAYETDTGATVRVSVRIERDRLTIDFAGTSEQQRDNVNAPLPIVRAACLYVMRTMLDTPVPMNDGCLRPVTIRVPDGSMLKPRYPAAVVAGNVETSQVVTDALFGAFGAMAGSQGTMNNFTFGDASRQYYETIAGGSGAGPGFDGTAVVQTHMTNSRLTDPEILEQRFPVLLESFAIRRGSGGAGAQQGGDGATRRMRFLAPMRANILSNRRRVPPFGLAGGADGGLGANRVERVDGGIEELPATASVDMMPGDVFVIETPGGGGYGATD